MASILADIGSAIGSTAGAAATGWLSPVLSIINKIIPDPTARAQAQLAVLQLQQSGQLQQEANDMQLALAQTQIDSVEAASASPFRGNWRPLIGWISGVGLGYSFLVQPLLAWLSAIAHLPVPPVLDSGVLMTLVSAMLGLGSLRSLEKLRGLT